MIFFIPTHITGKCKTTFGLHQQQMNL